PGVLQAVGTSSAPITFTANANNPPKGYWNGINIEWGPSTIAFANVSYATGGVGVGCSLIPCGATIYQTVFSNNSGAGLGISERVTATLNMNSFVGNGSGLAKRTSNPIA